MEFLPLLSILPFSAHWSMHIHASINTTLLCYNFPSPSSYSSILFILCSSYLVYYPYHHHSPSSCYGISLYSLAITLTPLMMSLLMSCLTMFHEVLFLTWYFSFLNTLVHAHLCLYKYDSLVLVTSLLICAILAYNQGSLSSLYRV